MGPAGPWAARLLGLSAKPAATSPGIDLETICERARHALEHCASECETACYSCLKHFRNQLDHEVLNRHTAINLLSDLALPLTLGHVIPAVVVQAESDSKAADSAAETSFVSICKERGFPA
jgi:hypothetical protein